MSASLLSQARLLPRRAYSRPAKPILLMPLGGYDAPVLFFRRRSSNANVGSPSMPGQTGPQVDNESRSSEESSKSQETPSWKATGYKMFESAATTFASLFVLGVAGYSYHRYYKYLVLSKINGALEPGDPVLVMAGMDKRPYREPDEDERHWMRRIEQEKIDGMVNGTDKGHYHLIIGEKGNGKSSMLLEAIQKVHGDGVAMFEAHADLEIFRVRLGKALDFEFHEDYIGSLFSIRGPRDTTALLDIERAFNKLEKVALQRRQKIGRPVVLVINSLHLLKNNQDGLLELIQQRSELWAATNLITVILNSDDYWVYERLKQLATRLEVLPILDLPKEQALNALAKYRTRYFSEIPDESILSQVYDRVGGRLSFLSRVAKAPNMLVECAEICQREKTWFLNQCWILGEEMDDDVMDQQKYCAAAMVLAKALVQLEAENEIWHPELGHILPEVSLHKAREIMTRADFIETYDHINLFAIDSRGQVRADSVPMQNAFREICGEPGFEEHLQKTLDRIAAIESLGRTREIVAKDLIDKNYRIELGQSNSRGSKASNILVGMEAKADNDMEVGSKK